MYQIFFIGLILYSRINTSYQAPYYQCDDPIFCYGKVLHNVQTLRIFHHSKTFVDLKMTNTPDVILQNFDIFMFKQAQKPSEHAMRKFLRENFADGDELETWMPSDYRSKPCWLQKIKDYRVRKYAHDLLQVIPKLTRKVRQNVLDHPIHYSFIAVPHGFLIPGGSNRESYYLDSYFFIKGLLVNDMTTTVKGILNNFILMERKYGYIPRGTRIYYCNNWQPPMLTILVDLYMSSTNDIYWLRKNIIVLDHELRHWLNYRCFELTRNGKVYVLARFTNSNLNPRPERYHKDYTACAILNNTDSESECYSNIKAPGGAGWYYPERYIFDEEGGYNGTLAQTFPRRLLPVDLNVYLCKSFKIMSHFYDKLNDNVNATFYKTKYDLWVRSIQKILYSPVDGIWFDYDIGQHKCRTSCYPTNFSPLWAKIFDDNIASKMGKKALGYFKKMNMMPFRGTSDKPPERKHDLMKMFIIFQHMVTMALYNSGDKEAQDFAREFVRRWLKQSIDCECCKYDLYDDIYLRSPEFQWGCGWIVLTALDFINTFFVKSDLTW